MKGERKSERSREREIDREREDQSGWRQWRLNQVGLGVEWSGLVIGGGQGVGEPGGAQPAVGCQDQSSTCTRRCMTSDRRGGSWVFVDR